MKIKIITIHAMHNPGSVFQAWALQEYLGREHETQIVDYQPDYFYHEGSRLKLLAKKLLYGKAYRSRQEKFIRFVRENMNLTPCYRSYRELEEAKTDAECFIAGSDQLWNTDFPCGKDPAFYLKFVRKGKKISYSTSVGKKNPDQANLDMLGHNLTDFDALSVREKCTAECLSQTLRREVKWVCDPVFLLPESRYREFVDDRSPVSDPYVMVYLAPESSALDELAAYYKNMGYKVVLAGGMTKRCACDLHIMDVGPREFLSLISHAQVVISTSFHATAFSHIFHKDFVSLVPESNGERVMSLLEQTGLDFRAVTGAPDFSALSRPIDWEDADRRLNEYIRSSRDYLRDALK